MEDFDSERFEGSYALQKILSPRSYVKGSMYYIQENRRHSSENIYVDFNEYKFDIFYVNKISYRYSANIFAEIRNREYEDFSSGFGSVRDDMGYKGIGTLSVTLDRDLRLNTQLGYETVDSNQKRFSYQKYTASLSLMKTF